MRIPNALTVALAVVALVVAAGVSLAQVPEQMNYQVMLTDDADQPLADQSVQLVFRIYSQVSGGSALWTETQNVTTNSIGVVSVVLGSVTPLTIDFSGPRWLEIQVGAEVMTPRRPLVAAPYALQADNSDNLGGTAAASFALSSTLSTAGTINSPGNPVDWTELKSVPAGFADGVDNTSGAGAGWADDGTVVRLETATDKVGIGTASPQYPLHVENPSTTAGARAIYGVATPTGNNWNLCGVYGENATTAAGGGGAGVCGLASGAGAATIGVYGYSTSANGYAGYFTNEPGTGYAGYFSAGKTYFGGNVGIGTNTPDYSLDVVDTNDGAVIHVENLTTAGYGDVAHLLSSSSYNETWTLLSLCYGGAAGYFCKYTDDDKYAMSVHGASVSSEGLYVSGTIVSTALSARAVPTSRGTEAVFGVTAADVDVIASGSARLSGGAARVEFDRLFAESIAGAADLRVTATPIGAWSALYVDRIDGGGFTLKSDAGDKDVEFHWVAIGRAKDYERTPEIAFPDPEEEARLMQEKQTAMISRQPVEGEGLQGVAAE